MTQAAYTDERMVAATEWFLRLREESVTTQEISEWISWCNQHPDNVRTFRKVQELWSRAGDAGVAQWPDAAEVQSDAYTGEVPVAEWRAAQAAARAGEDAVHPMHRRGGWAYGVGIAAALLVALGVWRFTGEWRQAETSSQYSTGQGVQRLVRLADGSTLVLGGATVVKVAYSAARRDLQLLQGEAFFKVTHDRHRPFIVQAGEARVRAVGTAFNVRADAARTVVDVTEGVVEVTPGATTPDAANEAPALRARAGQQIVLAADASAPALMPSETVAATGWQQGLLSFVDEPLRAVVARLNRYSTREIRLGDESLGELRFTGTVLKDEIDEWARGLARVFPVRVVADPQGRILLEPVEGPQQSSLHTASVESSRARA